ncbi:MAG: methylenetetrahydrofolate--tRNA-(uracil(54)-C(5))-methyltransferase (FADH(2)-oxidizing) TrmFO [Clostridia bacterium]
MNNTVHIVGAGLAGCEAAWQVAKRGYEVNLYEMRPKKQTPAHHTELFAELVCSNSLRADRLTNAVGLLKEEMRQMDSLIMKAADTCAVPAGGALAVDRVKFSEFITKKIKEHPLINVINEEVIDIDKEKLTIIAAGPLCSEELANSLKELVEEEYLHFFDAAAPIVTKESIDFSKAFYGARYEEDSTDYINCPMNKEQYQEFYNQLINAEVQEMKEFEEINIFEGCMPIEEMANRGEKTLLFGPLKPVGLSNDNCDTFHAVVQLRQDNKEGTLYNLVGFQTRLKWPEQKRVFRLIPGLEKAEFVRLGVMHRNTFINSPALLLPTGQLKAFDNILIAGQISGVEGYVESAASGLICGINVTLVLEDKRTLNWPIETAHGSLMNYITTSVKKDFQPMNITFGLIPPLEERIRKRKEKRLKISIRALKSLEEFIKEEKINEIGEVADNV